LADVVTPAFAAVAPYALIVKVVVALEQYGFDTVMVSVIVAPLFTSSVLNVYVGVYPVEPPVMPPGVPDVLLDVQSTEPPPLEV
jgi:hypothetical protein